MAEIMADMDRNQQAIRAQALGGNWNHGPDVKQRGERIATLITERLSLMDDYYAEGVRKLESEKAVPA